MNDIDDKYKKMGDDAWKEAREMLKDKGWNLQQIDWLGEKDGKWIKFEVKGQEPFDPPPFSGHGLPRWQIMNSMKLLKDKDIKTFLMIKDAKDNNWYGQFIDVLEKSEYFDTHGANPRRIYNLKEFKNIAKGNLNNV